MEDGSIWITCDDNEVTNLKDLCDLIFGPENFVSSFIWEKRTTRENRKVFSVNHDFILCYAKSKPLFECHHTFCSLRDKNVRHCLTNPSTPDRRARFMRHRRTNLHDQVRWGGNVCSSLRRQCLRKRGFADCPDAVWIICSGMNQEHLGVRSGLDKGRSTGGSLGECVDQQARDQQGSKRRCALRFGRAGDGTSSQPPRRRRQGARCVEGIAADPLRADLRPKVV